MFPIVWLAVVFSRSVIPCCNLFLDEPLLGNDTSSSCVLAYADMRWSRGERVVCVCRWLCVGIAVALACPAALLSLTVLPVRKPSCHYGAGRAAELHLLAV